MEFFKTVKKPAVNSDKLKELLAIGSLTDLCSSIDSVLLDNIEQGTIYCIWGEHKISRTELRYGVRFSLTDCPSSLAWSITTDSAGNNINIHCTINVPQHDEDFIESIEIFMSDWASGISDAFKQSTTDTNIINKT